MVAVLPAAFTFTFAVPVSTPYTTPVPETATAAPSLHHMSGSPVAPFTERFASWPFWMVSLPFETPSPVDCERYRHGAVLVHGVHIPGHADGLGLVGGGLASVVGSHVVLPFASTLIRRKVMDLPVFTFAVPE